MLSRDAILAFEDKSVDKVQVEEFGGAICIALLSAAEADDMSSNIGANGIPNNVFITILGACDEEGKRLFTMKDAQVLAKKPSKALTKIANAVLAFNGVGSGAADAAKNGSGETENGASDSALLSPSEEPSKS